MAESKIEFISRVRREKRWADVNAYLDTLIVEETKVLKAAGQKANRAKVADAAWKRTMAAFPSLRPSSKPASDVAVEGASAVDSDAEVKVVKEDDFPWADLPAKADPKSEADWIYANYKRVVIENASGKALIHWGEALTPPPSEGTRTLLKYAVGNFHGFIKDVWMKFNLSSDDVSDEENVRREKTAVEEIRGILESLRELAG